MYLIFFIIMTMITPYTIYSTKCLCVFKIIHLHTYINTLYFNETVLLVWEDNAVFY